MEKSQQDRARGMRQLSLVVRRINDGNPFGDGLEGFDPFSFVLDEMEAAQEDDFEIIVDLLRYPPSEEEMRAAWTDQTEFEAAMEAYAVAYALKRPYEFASITEPLVGDDKTKRLTLCVLSSLCFYSEADSDPFLRTFEIALRSPLDEDQIESLIGGLGKARSSKALSLLNDLRALLPPGPSELLRWIGYAEKEVAKRIGAGSSHLPHEG